MAKRIDSVLIVEKEQRSITTQMFVIKRKLLTKLLRKLFKTVKFTKKH